MICSRSKKHVRVTGDMVKSRIKNIVKLTWREPRLGTICKCDRTKLSIVVDDETVRKYLAGVISIDIFWKLEDRFVSHTFFDHDENILCRIEGCEGVVAGFIINVERSCSSQRDEKWC